jgi:hypothetical protein
MERGSSSLKVAFDLVTNKYNIWASENRNFLSYSMKIPLIFLLCDGNRDILQGTKASLRHTNNDTRARIWSTEQRSVHLIFLWRQ